MKPHLFFPGFLLSDGFAWSSALAQSPSGSASARSGDTIIVTAPGGEIDEDDAITLDRDALSRPGPPRRWLVGLKASF